LISRTIQNVSVWWDSLTLKCLPPKDPNEDEENEDDNENDEEQDEEPSVIREPEEHYGTSQCCKRAGPKLTQIILSLLSDTHKGAALGVADSDVLPHHHPHGQHRRDGNPERCEGIAVPDLR
jgi:hypothetical protein